MHLRRFRGLSRLVCWVGRGRRLWPSSRVSNGNLQARILLMLVSKDTEYWAKTWGCSTAYLKSIHVLDSRKDGLDSEGELD
jgi:hypothetical protein